jgi:hypothetical protein
MTRQEIEKRMDELARKYVETHDQKIVDQLYELARELEKIEKLELSGLNLPGLQGLGARTKGVPVHVPPR